MLQNEAGVSVRLCDGLLQEEEFDMTILPDPADRALAATGLTEDEITLALTEQPARRGSRRESRGDVAVRSQP